MSRRANWDAAAELALTLLAYGGTGTEVREALKAAAERAIREAPPDEAEIYRLEWIEGMDWRMASAAGHMSASTYFRRRAKLINRVKGWMV